MLSNLIGSTVNRADISGFLKLLIDEGKLNYKDVEPHLRAGKRNISDLEEPLTLLVGRQALLDAITRDQSFEGYIDLDKEDVDPEVASIIPMDIARNARVVCIGLDEHGMRLAMANPRDDSSVAMVEAKTDFRVTKRLYALQSDIQAFQRLQYGTARNLDVSPRDVFDDILRRAIEQGVSDIHMEPLENTMRVRFRKDGLLTETFDLRDMAPKKVMVKHLKTALPVVVKNKSGASGKTMNIAEVQKPQDGRIYLPGRNLDLRVSVLPTMYGESVVIRLHSGDDGAVDMAKLGFAENDLRRFLSIIQAPYGMILVSGPTGSGKTTTLYSVLRHLNKPSSKIVTIEDPIEYHLPGIIQSQTNPAKDYSFAEALRCFLRHDPDIIMVGEIRDRETATMAVEASLTGHLVVSTIHANDAVRTITRLKDLGINPLLLTSTCLATLAQRLMRTSCAACRIPARFSERFYEALDTYRIPFKESSLQRGAGCPKCNFTGYKGRVGIYELLAMTPEIRDAILSESTDDEVLATARAQGMRLLIEDALEKAARGLTTEAEVWRVTLSEGTRDSG